MASIFYALCALAAAFCAYVLLRAYNSIRYRLLLWGGFCFIGLTLNNALLIIDKMVLPEVNLFTWRLVVALVALLIMLYGILWDAE
jgi:hypothetical protein